jgi:site-specific recombinase XerD
MPLLRNGRGSVSGSRAEKVKPCYLAKRRLCVATKCGASYSAGARRRRSPPAGFPKMVERAGARAGFDFNHPHMLRHVWGFALANAGHDTRTLQPCLGLRNMQHTVRYAELAPGRFKDFGGR